MSEYLAGGYKPPLHKIEMQQYCSLCCCDECMGFDVWFTYIKLICGASVSDKNICGVCFEFHAPQIGERSNVGMRHEFYLCAQEDRKVKNDNMVFVGASF